MYTIIGKGFGLYGYLPAICLNKAELTLPIKYKITVDSRKDIFGFSDKITWSDNIKDCLINSEKVVLAIPPKEQFNFILENKEFLSNKILFLEKPLADNTKNSYSVLNFLKVKKIKFCINYSFLYINWHKKLKRKICILNKTDKITITWKFHAFHKKYKINSWKDDVSAGGGTIKFYAIHLLASLVDFGYEICNYIRHKDNKNILKLKFCNKNKPDIIVNIDIKTNSNLFSINVERKSKDLESICNLENPFMEHSFPNNRYDTRVRALQQHLKMKNSSLNKLSYNFKVIKLWESIETLEKKI